MEMCTLRELKYALKDVPSEVLGKYYISLHPIAKKAIQAAIAEADKLKKKKPQGEPAFH